MSRFVCVLSLCLSGCAMPGFSVSGTFTLPPVLMGSNTVASMPTLGMPTFAVEDHQQVPVIQHTVTAAPRPRASIMPPAQPQAELLPAPRPAARITNVQPCQEE